MSPDGKSIMKCNACSGSGVYTETDAGHGGVDITVDCHVCNGSGWRPPVESEAPAATVTSLEEVKSRQVRRAEARAVEKLEGGVAKTMDRQELIQAQADERMARLMRARHMLFCIIKREGRVRLSSRELASVTDRDKLDVKVQENGDLVLSFVGG